MSSRNQEAMEAESGRRTGLQDEVGRGQTVSFVCYSGLDGKSLTFLGKEMTMQRTFQNTI